MEPFVIGMGADAVIEREVKEQATYKNLFLYNKTFDAKTIKEMLWK